MSNIYKYYIAYTLILEQREAREALKKGGEGEYRERTAVIW